MFVTVTGTACRVGNFLKRVLKPIAKSAGIEDFDFRAMRSTASTLFQTHGTVKDTQGQMRHADQSEPRGFILWFKNKAGPAGGCRDRPFSECVIAGYTARYIVLPCRFTSRRVASFAFRMADSKSEVLRTGLWFTS